MKRRTVLQAGFGLALGTHVFADMNQTKLDDAVELLSQRTESGEIRAATLLVRHGADRFTRAFGEADSADAIFLLASITKPICMAAVMTLADRGQFELDDPVRKFIPEFSGDGRDQVSMRQLMTHVSGLPDQLPENNRLRSKHSGLSGFVDATVGTPLLFDPGSKYQYSSMGILLAAEAAQRISGTPIASLVDETVYRPLEMRQSALGVGTLDRDSLMRCQVENAAAESGAGRPDSTDWDWNSQYWRELGSPWGGAHGSAADVATFLDAFLHPDGRLLNPETARSMTRNHNPAGIRPRGLGFDLGVAPFRSNGPDGEINRSFGHGGSTGTLCWADPETDSVFVVLTTLPLNAVRPHPRDLVSALAGKAIE